MGIAIITPDVEARIREIVAYAAEHVYVPNITPVPGTLLEHAIVTGTYRIIFSHTRVAGRTYRHFSISCLQRDALPNQTITYELAKMFGFVDDPSTWIVHLDEAEHAVVIAQDLTM